MNSLLVLLRKRCRFRSRWKKKENKNDRCIVLKVSTKRTLICWVYSWSYSVFIGHGHLHFYQPLRTVLAYGKIKIYTDMKFVFSPVSDRLLLDQQRWASCCDGWRGWLDNISIHNQRGSRLVSRKHCLCYISLTWGKYRLRYWLYIHRIPH